MDDAEAHDAVYPLQVWPDEDRVTRERSKRHKIIDDPFPRVSSLLLHFLSFSPRSSRIVPVRRSGRYVAAFLEMTALDSRRLE